MNNRLQELAGIQSSSEQMYGLIIKAIDSLNGDITYDSFAKAVAKILKNEYGEHNFKPFIKVLEQELYTEDDE